MNSKLLVDYRNNLLNIEKNNYKERKIFGILSSRVIKHNLALVGLRQVGKTVLMQQLGKYYYDNYINVIDESIDKNAISATQSNSEKIFYINLKALPEINKKENLEDFLNSIKNPQYKLIMIDEIQMIEKWTNLIQAAIDLNPKARFIVSGSNAKAIGSETMVNRMDIYFVNPLLFSEYVSIWNNNDQQTYFDYGSYPKSHQYDEPSTQYRELVESSILDKVIVEDLNNMVDATKFKFLMKGINNHIGNEIVYKKLEEETKITRQTISEYIKFMRQTKLIHLIPKFNDSKTNRTYKIYFEDKSMINYFNDFEKLNNNLLGSLIENIIFSYLQQHYKNKLSLDEIYYYRNKNNKEIDFIIPNKKIIIECKYIKDLDCELLSKELNKVIEDDNINDYKKIVITNNISYDEPINGWYFYKLKDILEEKYVL